MCGLLGASSDSPLNMDRVKILYLMNKERGEHSCGFSDSEVLLKEKLTPEEYIAEIINGDTFPREVRSFIGHTRLATKGKITKENAHPFAFPDLVGTHNGTISNSDELQEMFDTGYDVDSEFLYYLLTKYELEEITPFLQGALALAYFDHRDDNEMTLYRWERPLYYGVDKDNDKTIWYSSLKYYLESIDCRDIKELPEHTVLKMKDGEIQSIEPLDEVTRPERPPTKYKYTNKVSVDELDLLSVKQYLLALENESVDKWISKEEKRRDEKSKKGKTVEQLGSSKGKGSAVNAHLKLNPAIPQYATVEEIDDKIIYWWFDASDYNVVYVKFEEEEIVCYDLGSPVSSQLLWEEFFHVAEDIYQDWYKLYMGMKLRLEREVK